MRWRGGGSRRHKQISLNIVRKMPLRGAQGEACHTYSSDVKVRAGEGKAFYYPDVVFGCEPDDADEYYLEKPCLVVEVTSQSTEWRDYPEKLVVYQSLPTVQSYLVVSQEKPYATLFYRQENGHWWVNTYEGLDQVIELPCPVMPLTLADVYLRVDFSLVQPEEN